MFLRFLSLFLMVGLVSANSNYDKIDKYLRRKSSESKTPEENLDIARDWLFEKLEASTSCLSFFCSPAMINPLKQFVALGEVDDPEYNCGPRTYGNLVINNQIVNGVAHRPTKLFLSDKSSIVEQVIHHYTLKHATNCVNVYPKKFAEKFQSNPEEFTELFPFIDSLASTVWFYKTNSLQYDIASRTLNRLNIENPVTAKTIFDMLKAKDPEQDADLVVLRKPLPPKGNSGQVEEVIVNLLNRYVYHPCKLYIQQTDEIFAPLEFDRVMGVAYDKDDSEDDHRFHEWLSRYRVCKKLVEVGNSPVVQKFVELLRAGAGKKLMIYPDRNQS